MSKNIRDKHGRRNMAESSSDEEFQGSEHDWQSDHEWNGEDSSLAGEASVMSEGTEEEQPEEEEEKVGKHKKYKKQIEKPGRKFNLDDVGTEDDGESRHPEDITERTDGMYSKNNTSDISDLSDIENQLAEAQHKFMDDKQSLSGMMGMADEVTTRGESLTKKASETSLVVERDTIKKGVLSNDQLSLFDDDELSFRSYTERTNLEDQIPQRDLGKMTSGRIEYINYSENEANLPKQTFGLGHIQYLDETKSNDSGSLISEQVDPSKSENVKNTQSDNDDDKSEGGETTSSSEEEMPSDSKSVQPEKASVKSSKSSETFVSRISNQPGAEDGELEHIYEEPPQDGTIEEVNEQTPDDLDDENQEQYPNFPESKEFEDPECSKLGEKHLCCFLNLGGGGDDGRENELVNRLKKLKDDIMNMRKQLSLARQECKKESEEVAKLIEVAAARNKAAEQNEIAVPNNSQNILLTYGGPTYSQEIIPSSLLGQATVLPGRAQVAIPSSLLEERLRTTRQNASSTYRDSLNELERMVEKEMASIKDSMIRLEPLNKIAAEWETVLPIRDPKRTTFKSDYKLELVTSEMRLQAPDAKNVTI